MPSDEILPPVSNNLQIVATPRRDPVNPVLQVPRPSSSRPPVADGSAISEYASEPSSQHHKPRSAVVMMSYKTEFDRKILRWSSYLDVLLVFAGLFSAIVTAFVIDSSHDLQEDFGKTTVDLLRKIASNDTLGVTQSRFRPPAIAIWVNALWYSSLSFSLLTALGAMWGKLWIQECAILANKVFSPFDNADLAAQKVEAGLSQVLTIDAGESWLKSGIHKHTVTGESLTAVLPAFMHFAILFFILGLIVSVWGDTIILSCLLLVFLAVGVIAYIVSARSRGTTWYRFLLVPVALYRDRNV